LQSPTFCKEENIEQFHAEFSDVAAIYRWPASVILMQLQLCRAGMATLYGIGPNVDSIFDALRARFGLSARDACVRLPGPKRDPKTQLQEHATVVERLAQVAYGNLPVEGRRSLALEAFL